MTDELHDFREAWLRETTRPRGDGQERVERAMRMLYRALGRATPAVTWFPSPTAAADELGGPWERRNVSTWRVGGQPPGESLARSFETAVRTALERHPSRPALEYSDGSHYFWHGTRVPASWIVDPSGVEAAHLLFWSSVEERRVGLEIVGWHRLLQQLSPALINRDIDPTVGELLEARMPDGETLRFLKVRCGTGREFALSVPPTMRTAREANAWTYGLTRETHELEART